MKKTTVCNKGLNHQEEEQGSQLIFSSCLSILEFLCEERSISLDSIEEHNAISFETHKENQVVNSKILNKVVDVSLKNCHEHTLYGFCEDQFEHLQMKLQFENPLHSKQIT